MLFGFATAVLLNNLRGVRFWCRLTFFDITASRMKVAAVLISASSFTCVF